MKAKKDGKLTTSPDPYGAEDLGATKIPGMPEYMETRPQMPGLSEFPNYTMTPGTGNVGHLPNGMPQNYMMPNYGPMIPKM